ncbi:MAG TPA: transcription antitermination factor NusB [Candidatus Sumerlaeota bacterium]|mgnify:CR=1 FL=1|nr:transcription antitermination factor NusB [Candidatus Sumerlaeota bacterium]
MKEEKQGKANRRDARRLALQILYAVEYTGSTPEDVVREYGDLEPFLCGAMNLFTKQLLESVFQHKEELDSRLQKVITNWKMDRLSCLDRNILRLAGAEIFHFGDIPPKVTINEYIDIAREFGNQDSPSFVNGILDRLAKESEKREDINGKGNGAGGGT